MYSGKCANYANALTDGQAKRLKLGDLLGEGSFACAYANREDPDRVIKLTEDYDDAISFANLGDKGLKALPKVYAVNQLLDANGQVQHFFAIEVERVTPLAARSDDSQSVGLLNDYLAQFTPGQLPKKVPKAKLFRECDNAKASKWLNDADVCRKVVTEAAAAYEELQRNGYSFEDAHAGNWGRNKAGKLVAIDLGYSSSAPRGKELPKLAGAKMRRRKKYRSLGADEVVANQPEQDNTNFFIGLAILGISIYVVSKANWTRVK